MMPQFGDARLPARFWAKVHVEKTGCWIWIASLERTGYGHLRWLGHLAPAHRVAYETLVGLVPEGLELDHVKARGCISRACCNPAHLEPVTHQVNCQRGEGGSHMAERERCPQGHPYDEENTYEFMGRRSCRACRRRRTSLRRAAETADETMHRKMRMRERARERRLEQKELRA